MAVTFMNTADVGDTSRWTSSSNCTVSSTTARTGTYSYRLSGGGSAVASAPATGYIKCGLYVTYTNATIAQFQIREGSTVHLTIVMNTTAGTVDLWRGDTTFGSKVDSGGTIATNTWYCVEVYYVIHDSTGECTVKLNGAEVITFSGDTRFGATGVPDNVNFYSGSEYVYLDDVAVRDDDWQGTGGIYVLVPDGSGDTTDWTASAGNDYDCVNEKPPDFTDYISTDASVANTIHLFTLGNLPITADIVASVAVCAYAKLDASGSGSMRCKMKYSGTTANGSDTALGTSATWVNFYRTTDPDGNPWSTTSVNGLQAGVETV